MNRKDFKVGAVLRRIDPGVWPEEIHMNEPFIIESIIEDYMHSNNIMCVRYIFNNSVFEYFMNDYQFEIAKDYIWMKEIKEIVNE